MADRIEDVLDEIRASAVGQNDGAEGTPATAEQNPEAQITPNPGDQQNTVSPDATEQIPAQGQQTEPPAQPMVQPDASQVDPRSAEMVKIADEITAQRNENARLTQELEQLKAQLAQQSQTVQENIEEKLTAPDIGDLLGMEYLSDDERKAKTDKFAADLSAYIEGTAGRMIAPMKAAYEKQTTEARDTAVKSALSSNSGFPGFADDIENIDAIVAKTPMLSRMDNPEEKYALAYLISRGVKSINEGSKQRSADDIYDEASKNPEVMRRIEENRAKQIADKNAGLPALNASSGMATAPATMIKRPEKIEDVLDVIKNDKRFS